MSDHASITAHSLLKSTLSDFISSTNGLMMVSLATADGFNIETHQSGQKTIEPDMLSAISSSLFALSQASAKKITGEPPQITSVETSLGTILLISTQFQSKSCVLTVFAHSKVTLGALRYTALKLSKKLQQIS